MKLSILALLAACSSAPSKPTTKPGGPVVIDRFSAKAGHLLVRDQRPSLPAPGAPIDLEHPPFLTQGLGPDGVPVRYYNFDIQPDVPANRYRFTYAGKQEPLEGQLDVVDVVPGDDGYSDFWRIVWVEVPATFVPGSITSVGELATLPQQPSPAVLDCPIVPAGTKAKAEPAELWYRGQRVTCLGFPPALELGDDDRVPTSPIYVTFKTEEGPASGFRTEGETPQTHNVVFSVPGDVEYSPLWSVHIYDREAFDRVHDERSALAAPGVKQGPLVNCPIVWIGTR